MKKLFTIFLAIASIALVSCNPKEEVNKLLRVTPSESSILLAAGETATITVKFTPESEAKDVVWETSDEKIATVSSAGIITGISAGAAVIRAVAGSIIGTVKVDVFGGGNSTWSIIGNIHGSNWDIDYSGVEKDGYIIFEHIPLEKEVKEKDEEDNEVVKTPASEFKIRKDAAWTVNRGGPDTHKNADGKDVDKTVDNYCTFAPGTGFQAIADGSNLKNTNPDGFYDVYYFPAKETILILNAGAELPKDKDIPDFVNPGE